MDGSHQAIGRVYLFIDYHAILFCTYKLEMFCCTPRSLLLSVSKLNPDYQNKELYSDTIANLIRKQATSYMLAKQSHLDIDERGNTDFKAGQHNSQSKFSFYLCDSTRQITLNETMSSKKTGELWRVLTEKQSHLLREGDKIKIGLTEFEVYSKMTSEPVAAKNKDVITKQHCRYCFGNVQNLEDPLVSLCKCSGSVRFLHLGCLRSWINTKVEKEIRQNVTFYIYHTLECQICKTSWPQHFQHASQPYNLLAFEEDSQDESFEEQLEQKHLILATDSLDEEELEIKIFAKINVSSRFSIGDQFENADLSLDTFGVSPIHCSFYFQDSNIYVIDCGSTTGTLISMHEEELFSTKSGIFLQFNQTLMQLKGEDTFFECLYPETVYKIHLKSRSLRE